MEPNRFLFKLSAIFLQYLLLIVIFLPVIYLAQIVKFKFHPDEIYFLKVLFLAIAIAMPFAVANAFAFADYEKMDLTYYLKSKQKHKVIIEEELPIILKNITTNISGKPFWKPVSQTENSATYKVKSILVSDLVTFNLKQTGAKQTELLIESRPRISFLFLDFGRNYRNILTVLLATKPN